MSELNFNQNIYETIRKNIIKYRKEKRMTSAELAEKMGLSHDFIRQIQCKGKKTKNGYKPYNFSVDTFYRFSVALGVKLDDLIQEYEEN